MPLKFKIYYSCAIGLLLWVVGIAIAAAFSFITDEFTPVSDIFAEAAVASVILAITFIKGMASINAWKHYRHGTELTRKARRLFIVTYCYIVLFAAGLLLSCSLAIIPAFFTGGNYYTPGLKDMLLDGSCILAAIIALYFAIVDLMLLKAIRKKHEDSLVNFEVEGA